MEQAVIELMISKTGLEMVEIQLKENYDETDIKKVKCFASPRIAQAIKFSLGAENPANMSKTLEKMLLVLPQQSEGIWFDPRYYENSLIILNERTFSYITYMFA
jgi:hypothetical protein